jgi:hypothetical protein
MTTSLLVPPSQVMSAGAPTGGTDSNAPLPPGPPGIVRGLCSLSWGGRTFSFRTNPNEIWWSYELIRKVEDTYGGRVIQLLGTKMGDLRVKVEIGHGGWSYLMQVVLMLRDLLSDQRNGQTADFRYTTRNWHLKVYAMTVPFEDRVEATTREIELSFRIQEDVTGVLSRVTLDAELLRLQDGVYGAGRPPHNQYNDYNALMANQLLKGGPNSDPVVPGGPNYDPSGITNTVDVNPLGSNPQGINPLSNFPFLSSIPGLSALGL